MKARILGAHSFESKDTRLSAVLIDDIMAIDAGGLTSSLSFPEQERIDCILLTHGHYDHIRDVPAIALKNQHRTIDIFAIQTTLDVLSTHLINGILYPKFTDSPSPEQPALRLNSLEPFEIRTVADYQVLPVPMPHAVPSVGFQITDSEGKSLFFSGDTGPGLSACWERVAPDILIIDMHFSNRSADIASTPGHLCPGLLAKELDSFSRIQGYLPRVVLTHMNQEVEEEIRSEATEVAKELGVDMCLAYEDMELEW